MTHKRRVVRWILWSVMALVAVSLVLAAIVAIPILTHSDAGPAEPVTAETEDPSTASTRASDGRTRTLSVFAEDGTTPADLSAVSPGERFVVKGTGFDPSLGVYIAVCKDPGDPKVKPSPCLGGIPEDAMVEKQPADDNREFIESTWITDNWAWRGFATRGFDNADAGEFTAYLLIPSEASESLDCTVERCAIVSRNDHTALSDRAQDVLVDITYKKR